MGLFYRRPLAQERLAWRQMPYRIFVAAALGPEERTNTFAPSDMSDAVRVVVRIDNVSDTLLRHNNCGIPAVNGSRGTT